MAIDRRRFVQTLAAAPFSAIAAEPPVRIDGGPFVPTPWVILDEMIKLAEVRAEDTVCDLGSGDGRLVIAAAKRHGASGFGIERDAALVKYANDQAGVEGVGARVKFLQGDIFEADLRSATVVLFYLLPRLAERLAPKLRAELPAGARIVSHDYALRPWPPDKTLNFDVEEKELINGTALTTLYYYLVPARIGGRWLLQLPSAFAEPPGEVVLAMNFMQSTNALEGSARLGDRVYPLREPSVRGEAIKFGLLFGGRLIEFRGRINGQMMAGDARSRKDSATWTARVD